MSDERHMLPGEADIDRFATLTGEIALPQIVIARREGEPWRLAGSYPNPNDAIIAVMLAKGRGEQALRLPVIGLPPFFEEGEVNGRSWGWPS